MPFLLRFIGPAGLLILLHLNLHAQRRWTMELQFGTVHSLDLPLTIYQEGQPDLHIAHADFYSEPLVGPPYWDLRLSKWFGKHSLEMELVHHKFFLRNKPEEVQRFGISHGYNMIFLNHGRSAGKFIFRGGVGTAFIHGESTVRGLEYPEDSGLDLSGHRIKGVSVNFSCARQLKITKTFFLNLEAKVHGSVANVPVVNGHARVHIVVFQLALGPGVNAWVREEK